MFIKKDRFTKTICTLFCISLTVSFSPLRAASDTFIEYQNYNHGYCPECNCFPCRCKAIAEELGLDEEDSDPPCPACGAAVPSPPAPPPPEKPCEKPNPCNPAPVCGTNCGISLWWVGIGIAAVATAAAIIISSNNGNSPSH